MRVHAPGEDEVNIRVNMKEKDVVGGKELGEEDRVQGGTDGKGDRRAKNDGL